MELRYGLALNPQRAQKIEPAIASILSSLPQPFCRSAPQKRAKQLRSARFSQLKGNLLVLTEIEERKQVEAKLRSQTLELEQTLKELRQTQTQLIQQEKMSSLGQLVSGVAHEINNPVNFVQGNLDHAQQYVNDLLEVIATYETAVSPIPASVIAKVEEVDLDLLKTDLPKLMNSMKLGAERIQGIVKALRNFSRLDESAVKALGQGTRFRIELPQQHPTETKPEPVLPPHCVLTLA